MIQGVGGDKKKKKKKCSDFNQTWKMMERKSEEIVVEKMKWNKLQKCDCMFIYTHTFTCTVYPSKWACNRNYWEAILGLMRE